VPSISITLIHSNQSPELSLTITANRRSSQLHKNTKLLFCSTSGPQAEPAFCLMAAAGFFLGAQQLPSSWLITSIYIGC
jgi:hypothetical protein